MSNFTVNPDKLTQYSSEMEQIEKALKGYRQSISTIGNNLYLKGAYAAELKNTIIKIAESVGNEEQSIKTLYNTLVNIAEQYKKAESTIVNSSSDGTMPNDSYDNSNERNSDDNDSDKADIQKAIDILNNISLSTSVDGAVLTVVEYLISLFKNFGESGIPSSVGHALGFAGLATGIVADIMSAVESGSTINALLADVIVDIALWGVGEGVSIAGGAIGTAIGGPIGTVVGKFVGGMIGNGASIVLNVDWDGDGVTGKDAISDWLDNEVLDNVRNDKSITA